MSTDPLFAGPPGTKGLLLDFGAVISRTLFEIMPHAEEAFGLPAGTLKHWRGPFDPQADLLWARMQRDEISERDYWAQRAQELSALTGVRLDVRTMFVQAYELPQAAIIRPEIEALVLLARSRRHRVGLLTNELELFHGRPWMNRLDILGQMDFIVDATHTHVLKPDPAAYAMAVEAMQLPRGNIIFLDDQARNVHGAIKAGLQALHFDVARPAACTAAAQAWLGLNGVNAQ